MIEVKGLYSRIGGRTILNDINMRIERGTFTAILGRNGSGKSTLAKHLNGLMIPKEGSVTVDGIPTSDEERIFDIREKVGIVFQNPESQAAAAIVEDDTAFGPENLGLDAEEIAQRTEFALKETGIYHLRRRPINELSGGQKQLAAIAGILAMRPRYIVFDESTSMLDPVSRKKVISCARRLKSELNMSVIWITHYMEEAALSDRIMIMDGGRITADAPPAEIFSDPEMTEESGLCLPPCAKLCQMLKKSGLPIQRTALDADGCADIIYKLMKGDTK